MFWDQTKPLYNLSLGIKLALTVLLVVAGIGYLLGFANIYLTYNAVDGKPGLSVQDIRLAFHGSTEGTKLEKAITGGMKQYFASDADFQKVSQWVRAGGKESGFADVQPVLLASCSTCHSKDSQAGGVVTDDYASISPLLARDTGMPISRLVSISHTHVLAALPLIFVLCLVFSFTRFPQALKSVIIVLALLTIPLDIGSWWLAKASAALAPLVIVGGVSLGLAFLVLVLLPLYDMWLRTADAGRSPGSARAARSRR